MFRAKRDIKKQTLQADPKLAMEPKQLPTQTAGRGCFADVSSEARHQKTDPAGRPTGSLHSPNNQHCRHRNEVSSGDRKSTRLNSSHVAISYAVFCLKKKNNTKPILLKYINIGII